MVRVYKRKYEVRYPVIIAQDHHLGLAAKGLYAYLLCLADPEYIALQGMVIDLKETEQTIRTALLQLESAGLVDARGILG